LLPDGSVETHVLINPGELGASLLHGQP